MILYTLRYFYYTHKKSQVLPSPPDLKKVLTFCKWNFFGGGIGFFKTPEPNLCVLTKTIHFLGNKTKYHLHVVSFVGKFHKLMNSAEIYKKKLSFVLF